MQPSFRRTLITLFLQLLHWHGSLAQLTVFSGTTFASMTIKSFNTFFIYHVHHASDNFHRIPTVVIEDMKVELKVSQPPPESFDKSLSLKVGLAPYGVFSGAQNCRFASEDPHHEELMTVAPMAGKKYDHGIWVVSRPGAYVLFVSNCFDFPISLSGSIKVQHGYGHLPGVHYPKMNLFFWLEIIYLSVSIFWALKLYVCWEDLFNIHLYITLAVCLSTLECVVFHTGFTKWNTSGECPIFLQICAHVLSLVQALFSYLVLWTTTLGWGFVHRNLDPRLTRKIAIVAITYVATWSVGMAIANIAPIRSLSMSFVIFCLLPLPLLNGTIFVLLFKELSDIHFEMVWKRAPESKVLYRLEKFSLFGVFYSLGMLIFVVYDLMQPSETRWLYQWILTDAMPRVLTILLLLTMMGIWAATTENHGYYYSKDASVDSSKEEGQIVGDTYDMEYVG